MELGSEDSPTRSDTRICASGGGPAYTGCV